MEKLIKVRKKNLRGFISALLILAMVITSIGIEQFGTKVYAQGSETKIYFKDKTENGWISHDNAVIEAVDNSKGHIHYGMTKEDDTTWSVKVPSTSNNFTFNRLSSDGKKQWNSWSAGGRDGNNTYCADGHEYGHWENTKDIQDDNYFHAGDIVYLDLTAFPAWKNNNTKLYVNFTGASKKDNNDSSIELKNANKSKYNPKCVDIEIVENVYAYVVGFEDEKSTELRFWRGNKTTLWNCSKVLTYEDYSNGLNCVKIKNWNDSSSLVKSENAMDIEVDSDGDGISDYYEIILKTDKNDIDTDKDGLLDSHELHLTKSNPCKYDSLESSVSDFDVDNDNDGIINGEEVSLGTDPNNSDSDNDGLSDGQEVNAYYTDPLNTDTDGDTLTDGDEICLKFSPLLKDTDSNGVLDCDEKVFQSLEAKIENNNKTDVKSVSVEFGGTGNINSTTTIEDVYEKESFVSETVGLVGVPIEIKSSSNFDSAKVTFYLDKSTSQQMLDNLLILWYDEKNDRFVEQKTDVNVTEKCVSTEVKHFSKYMVVDKRQWFETWQNEIKYNNGNRKFDTVISIDCSGSMSSNDPIFKYTVRNTLYPGSSYEETTCYRKLASMNFINAQTVNDQTGIVLFTSSSQIACGLTNDKFELASAIDKIYSNGGTNFDSTISASVGMLKNARIDSEKMILLVSDGESSLSQSTLNSAISNNVTINTVYIGGQNDNELLRKIALQTGGEYFKAVTADELVDIYSKIIVNQKFDETDRDMDGIADIFEISGMKLSNGTVIYTDPDNPDTDGDGLLDGEEVNNLPSYWLHNIFDGFDMPIQVGGYIFTMNSNPNKRDSDDDGLLDGKPVMDEGTNNRIAPKDPNPMTVDGPKGMWKKHISELKYGNRIAHYLDGWYDYEPNLSWNILNWNWSELLTGLGSRALMFKSDEKDIAVHSQYYTWQSIGGYNNLYDDIFHIGTFGNMDREKYVFNCDGENYVIWTWRGDYLNLGSGAEIGIYTNVHKIGLPYTPLQIDQWDVDKNCSLKMHLYLYNYYNINSIDNVFCWEPNDPQWWITGFNPDFDSPNVHDMISIGMIDFESKTQMYEALKKSVNNKQLSNYLIFDEDGHTLWMMWGDY